MKTLIITGDRNSPNKRDYTGAFQPEAERFSELMTHDNFLCRTERINISLSMKERRKQFADKISCCHSGAMYNCIAFFMHGWAKGIQCGLRLEDLEEFAYECVQEDVIASGSKENPIYIILYCCLTADVPGSPKANQKKLGPGGDGGFADRMRDEFCKHDEPWIKIYAHTTAGHTTRNPYVRTFEGKGSQVGGVDGDWLVRPKKSGVQSPLWDNWVKALLSKQPFNKNRMMNTPNQLLRLAPFETEFHAGDFRFFAPFMTVEELHRELI